MKRYLRHPTAWVGMGLTAFVLLVSAASSGIGGVLIMAGLIGLGTGLYTVVTRRPSWLALSGRKKFGPAWTDVDRNRCDARTIYSRFG